MLSEMNMSYLGRFSDTPYPHRFLSNSEAELSRFLPRLSLALLISGFTLISEMSLSVQCQVSGTAFILFRKM